VAHLTKKQKTILLVEDEPIFAASESRMLRNNGYRVLTADTGGCAVDIALDDTSIDLVLMDVDLGRGMSGPDAAKLILAKRDLPIVFLTSHSEKRMVEKVKSITRYGYVIKNSGDFVLLSSIDMAFELFDAHEKTRESERKYRLLAENSKDFIWTMDLEGRFTYASPAALAMTGHTPEELTRLSIRNLLVGPHAEQVLSEISAELAKAPEERARSRTIEVQYYKKDGTVADIESTVGWLFDDQERPAGLQGSSRDITERKRERESLLKTQFAMDRAPDSILWVDDDGSIAYANDSACSSMGFTREELLSMKVFDIDPDFPEDRWEQHKKEMRHRGAMTFESRHRTKDGRFFPVEVSTKFFRYNDRFLACAFDRDISERKKAEGALREAEQRYRILVDNSQGIIYTIATDGTMTFVSPSWKPQLGHEPAEIIGRDFRPLVHEEDVHICEDFLLRTAQTGAVQPGIEYRVFHKDGSVRWHRSVITPVFDEKRTLTLFVGNAVDITAHRLAEDRVRRLLDEKEILLKEVHHRIKNHMNIMTSLLSLQSQTIGSPEAVTALGEAARRMQSMGILYDRLYRSENMRDMPVGSYLSPLVDEIVGMFPGGTGVRIEKRIDDFELEIRLLSPLGMIVNELIANSMKYAFRESEHGEIRVCASKRLECVTVTVEDNGTGIPESVDIENSPGFGLRLVRLLVKQIGGKIELERAAGTRFTLSFETR